MMYPLVNKLLSLHIQTSRLIWMILKSPTSSIVWPLIWFFCYNNVYISHHAKSKFSTAFLKPQKDRLHPTMIGCFSAEIQTHFWYKTSPDFYRKYTVSQWQSTPHSDKTFFQPIQKHFCNLAGSEIYSLTMTDYTPQWLDILATNTDAFL